MAFVIPTAVEFMLSLRAEEETSSFSERRCGWLKAILRLKPRCSLFAARMYPRYKNEICRHGTGAQLSRAMSIDMVPGAQLSRAMSIDMVPGRRLVGPCPLTWSRGRSLVGPCPLTWSRERSLVGPCPLTWSRERSLVGPCPLTWSRGAAAFFLRQRIGFAADAATRAECHVNGHGTTTRPHPLTCHSRRSRVFAAKNRCCGRRRDAC